MPRKGATHQEGDANGKRGSRAKWHDENVGGVGLALEQSAGQIYPQGWEFYAVTAALFLTLAFPGFVYRYLLRHRA